MDPTAAEVRRKSGLPTVAVGLITEAQHAEMTLREGRADMIALPRELMHDPNWPMRAARELSRPDAFGVLPESKAFRLRSRDAQMREMSPGSEVRMLFGLDRSAPYSWTALCAEPPDRD
jgi:hypothetical protein